MDKYYIQSETLTDLADAIREKNGSTSKMRPTDMPGLIAELVSPSGTITVGLNSVYDVTQYRNAVVATGRQGARFAYGWKDSTGTLVIWDDNNPLPEVQSAESE